MITIYGRDGCAWCKRAIELCEVNDIEHVYKNMSEMIFDQAESTREFLCNCGFTTVPAIFKGNDKIGGYEDLVKYLNSK